MKIWIYNLNRHVTMELIKHFNNVLMIGNTNNLSKNIKKEDKFICFWNDKETLEVIDKLQNNTFPSKEIISEFADGREKMTKFVEKYSKFSTPRDYINFKGTLEITVPKLENSLKVVAKVGSEHQGDNKFCLYPGQKLMIKDSVIFEEFLDNAKSVRVLLIGDTPFIVEYFDDPDLPKMEQDEWIKNINPIIKVRNDIIGYEDLVSDTINMSKIMGYDYIAVDYVINEYKTIALEINIFPGLAGDNNVIEKAKEYWIKKVEELMR